MKLDIPENHIELLTEISQLTAEDIREINKNISRSPITLSASKLIQFLEKNSEKAIINYSHLIKMLLSMLHSINGIQTGPHEFVKALINSGKENDYLNKATNWESLRQNLELFLSEKNLLELILKGPEIYTDHQKIYRKSKVITDIRPIFYNNDENVTTTIVHNLKIELNKNQEEKIICFYIALDSNDLLELKNNIDRAIMKEEKLKNILDKSEIEYIDI